MTDLVQAALNVRLNAHAPFSHFLVGAALEDSAGQVHTGCNVENATYGLTICAERNAVFKAVSEGARKFTRIAIVADVSGSWHHLAGLADRFCGSFAAISK